MQSINFSTGYKEYAINGDDSKTIRVNISDLNIPARVDEVQNFFENLADKFKEEDRQIAADDLSELDKQLRDKINYAFGSDVCTNAFGTVNCLSPLSDGKMLAEAFLEQLIPVVEADMKAAAQAHAVHIKSRAEEYIAAAKNAPADPQNSRLTDITEITKEQKDAILKEYTEQGK